MVPVSWHPDMPEHYRNTIVTGDARVLSRAIPDESVDLIFTDPVYQNVDDYQWLAETAARVLKPERCLVAFAYTAYLPKVMEAMGDFLHYVWLIIWYRTNEIAYRYAPIGKSVFTPALVYSKGTPDVPGFAFDLRGYATWTKRGMSNHPWSKPVEWVSYYIGALSECGDTVADFFSGGGVVPASCKILERNFVAFEIDPATTELARHRVANTQPPLPGLVVEQLPLDKPTKQAR